MTPQSRKLLAVLACMGDGAVRVAVFVIALVVAFTSLGVFLTKGEALWLIGIPISIYLAAAAIAPDGLARILGRLLGRSPPK